MSSSETLRKLGIDEAFETAVVDYCVVLVKSGREMTKELMVEAMHAALRRQMELIGNADAVRLVSDRIWCELHGSGVPAKRTLSDADRAAWPRDGASLMNKHFPK